MSEAAGAAAAGASSATLTKKVSPEGRPPAKRRPTEGMDVEIEAVRNLNLESEPMPPPPARVPYEKAKDPVFHPLAINSIRRSRPTAARWESTAGGGSSSAQPTPTKAVASMHVTDVATSYAAAAVG